MQQNFAIVSTKLRFLETRFFLLNTRSMVQASQYRQCLCSLSMRCCHHRFRPSLRSSSSFSKHQSLLLSMMMMTMKSMLTAIEPTYTNNQQPFRNKNNKKSIKINNKSLTAPRNAISLCYEIKFVICLFQINNSQSTYLSEIDKRINDRRQCKSRRICSLNFARIKCVNRTIITKYLCEQPSVTQRSNRCQSCCKR